MTVTTDLNKVFGLGTGAATVFSFSPVVLPTATSDLKVTKVDAADLETLLVEGGGATNYSVSTISFPGTGSITYPASGGTPLASGEKVVMERILTPGQDTDLQNQGGYFADVLEAALDRLAMQDIQQQDQLDRTFHYPVGEVSPVSELPGATERSDGFLGFDSGGALVILPESSGSALDLTKVVGGAATTELTIASGSITPTRAIHTVDTEADAASDNLDEITVANHIDGALLLIRADNTGRTVVMRHNQAVTNPVITLDGTNITLNTDKQWVLLKRDGAQWEEVSSLGQLLARQGKANVFTAGNTFQGPISSTGINTFTKRQTWAKGADVASATALALGDDGNAFDVTGTTTITSIGTKGVGTWALLQFDGVLLFSHNANIIQPGGAGITTAAGDMALIHEFATGQWRVALYSRVSGEPAVAPLPAEHINGLKLSNNSGDATNDIDIAVGKARDTADTANLVVASAIGKQIDASWAAGGTPGTTTGGLSSSLTLTNDTWYHVILGKVSGTVEVGFDTSATGANLVNDHAFTNVRRISSVRRDTATNRLFTQYLDKFYWTDVPVSLSDTTPATTDTLVAMDVPPLKVVWMGTGFLQNNASATIEIRSPDEDDAAAAREDLEVVVTVSEASSSYLERLTDSSGQISYRGNDATVTAFKLYTIGWVDPRGRAT